MSAAPARDKKQIVVVSIFGVLLLVFVVYAYNSFFGGSPNPAATAPVATRSSESRVETETTVIPAGNGRRG
jgi:flagellar basal body-associated protein FliL